MVLFGPHGGKNELILILMIGVVSESFPESYYQALPPSFTYRVFIGQ